MELGGLRTEDTGATSGDEPEGCTDSEMGYLGSYRGARMPVAKVALANLRAYSSVGGAPVWQTGGAGFKSRWVHVLGRTSKDRDVHPTGTASQHPKGL